MEMSEVFKEQRKLQLECYPEFMRKFSVEERLSDNLKHMIHEIVETERELNFKHWKQPVVVDWDKAKNELVDVFIFFMNACNEMGMDVEELLSRITLKQGINRKRQSSGY